MRRRSAVLGLVMAAFGSMGCGSSPPSRVKTLGTPSGKGEIRFEVENQTSVVVNNLFLAKSQDVKAAGRAALDEGTAEQAALWGEDRLPGSGLEPKGRVRIAVESPGRYDVRAVDRDGRFQHVAGIRLVAGGRYILELGEGGWRAPR